MGGNLHPNSNTKKSFIKRTWKTFVGILTVGGVIWGVLTGIYWFTEKWHEYEVFKESEKQVLDRLDKIEANQKKLLNYVDKKSTSFAVGFRVFKMEDEETGKTTLVKRYRDWDGVWHEIFRDKELSDLYGVDYYYYIDKQTDEKIYCW